VQVPVHRDVCDAVAPGDEELVLERVAVDEVERRQCCRAPPLRGALRNEFGDPENQDQGR
jgi:hypothetical protein